MADTKPFIVGEGPNPSHVGKRIRPLFGNPTRVLLRTMGMDGSTFRTAFKNDVARYRLLLNLAQPVNLCEGVWDLREAESRAAVLGSAAASRRFVLLGRRVARAFGCRDLPFLRLAIVWDNNVLVVPHPSGLNRIYNDPAERARIGTALRNFLYIA